MARKRDQTGRAVEAGVRLFLGLPAKAKVGVVVVLLVAGAVALAVWAYRGSRQTPPGPPVPPGTVVFMLWNVENLFDDVDDRRPPVDERYDDWFANNPDDRKLKYDHLAEIILRENGGKGPDLLACVEVESVRAAELLKEALNAKLPADAPRYEHLAMIEVKGGRHIAPCLISRLPVDKDRTRLHGSRLRILETHVAANGHDLAVIASHWTSQLKQEDGSEGDEGREKYAGLVHAAYTKAVRANPAVDFLVCGDFNDSPDSEPVANVLHVTADRASVTPSADPPRLFGLLSGKPVDRYSTHYYDRERRPLIYDQIAVSPGLLDERGWTCDPDSVRVVTEGMMRNPSVRRPWRFGNQKGDPQGRGYADHFPVVVNLRLGPAETH